MAERPSVRTLAGIVPTLVFLVVYVPVAGHGFVSDDFRWVLNSRLEGVDDLVRIFRLSDGFYRPMVSLTFGLDRLLFGIEPRGYGWTNVGLVLLTAALIRQLAVALGLAKPAATLAASLWLLNFHGINMSILWICGRTALVLACAATASALCLVTRRAGWALLGLAVALLSKEEAFTLPFVLAGWIYLLAPEAPEDMGARLRRVAKWLLPAAVIVAAYLAVRASTGAMTPATAPSYYRFTFAPAVVGRNIFEYADRAATVSAIALVLGFLLLGPKRIRLEPRQRRVVLCGVIWIVGGFGTTVLLPVRSSLYAIVPSIGACLVAATLLSALWQFADPRRRQRALVAAVLLPVFLIPVYRARTGGTVPLAEFSTQVLRDIHAETADLPEDAAVVLTDDLTTPVNVATAFGTLLNDAVLLKTGRRLNVWIEPPAPATQAMGLEPPCGECVRRRLRVASGRVVASP